MVEEDGIVYSVAISLWNKIPRMRMDKVDGDQAQELPADASTVRAAQQMHRTKKERVSFD